ncbi:MAG: hypothetical protein KAU03_03785, partial [Candidatus Altiarchaeales archaeon]|nr:hypothetical protein [Candidatus Altiarchaeales archaeon]
HSLRDAGRRTHPEGIQETEEDIKIDVTTEKNKCSHINCRSYYKTSCFKDNIGVKNKSCRANYL